MDTVSNTLKGTYYYVTSGIGREASDLAGNSGLWGANSGPADALRHISRAAMLTLEVGAAQARALLDLREVVGMGSTNTSMDYYNNAIGVQIGSYLREQGNGSREKAKDLAKKLVETTLNDADLEKWRVLEGGIIVHPDNKKIKLEQGLEVSMPAFAQYAPGKPVHFLNPDPQNNHINIVAP